MAATWDGIVIGTGGVGSAALMHLAHRGLRVVGLDEFPAGHDRGSSHGHTRVIRQAYFEHPDYVPLLKAAYALWAELEQRVDAKLYYETGLLEVGPPDGIVVPGVLRSAAQHALDVERITAADARRRFPGFVIPDELQIVFEQQAGYLLVEACVQAHHEVARQLGAEHHVGERVVGWSHDGGQFVVRTAKETLHAPLLIVTAGPWAAAVLADLQLPLHVRRKHVHWYAASAPDYRQDRGAPVFFFEVDRGFFYGFPEIDPRGVKVAEHSGGDTVDDPLTDPRLGDPRDQQRVEQFLAKYLPKVTRQSTAHDVCYYTMTPDEHFIVDRHPELSRLVFAAGLSGHGFKFTSVLGKILADMVVDGETRLPVEFLRLRQRQTYTKPDGA